MKRLVLIALLAAGLSVFAKSPKVGDISCAFENLHLFASFSMQEGFLTPDVLESLESTKPTTFTYEVEVTKKRIGWFDKTVLRKVVEKTVTYDNLTRQYDVITILDGEEKERFSLTSIDEVAAELAIAPATAKRDWALARAWLRRRLQSEARP